MAGFDPLVLPIFATPLGFATVPGSEALNPSVARLLAERATPEHADPSSRPPMLYCSQSDLFEWADEPVRQLTRLLAGAALAVIRSVNSVDDATFRSLHMQMRAWYTIIRPDGYVPSGSYPNAAWCAVYCVAAPQGPTTRHDSGILRLHEAVRTTMFSDATNTTLHEPYRIGHRTWQPVPGQLAVFPAAITHEIATLRGEGELVLVSALLRFIAPGQTGMPWW